MRVGKQQVIWSEADALSGTELTNSSDLSYHWTHFESAENLRKNVRMVKLNYILPDFLKTANNEAEGFWIPGDYEGNGAVVSTDIRDPYCLRLPLNFLGDSRHISETVTALQAPNPLSTSKGSRSGTRLWPTFSTSRWNLSISGLETVGFKKTCSPRTDLRPIRS